MFKAIVPTKAQVAAVLLRQPQWQRLPHAGLPYCQKRNAKSKPLPNLWHARDARTNWKGSYDPETYVWAMERWWAANNRRGGIRGVEQLDQERITGFGASLLDFWNTELRTPSLQRNDRFAQLLRFHQSKGTTVKHIHALQRILPQLNSTYHFLHDDLYKLLSAQGDAESIVVLLDAALQRRKQGHKAALVSLTVQAARRDLQKLISRNDESMWELLVMEAKLLLAENKPDAAIVLLKKSLPAAKKAAQEGEQSKIHGEQFIPTDASIQSKGDIYGLMTPWDDLMEVYHSKRAIATPANQALLTKEISHVIDVGLEANSALSHWYAAERADEEYRRDQQQASYDEDIRLTREPRRPEHIGKSSAWLYHMTKAAASMLPDACTELGRFYWSTHWRYLDDEPSASTKPTPLDRYPEKSSMSAFTIWNRLKRAVGVSPRVSTPEDVFKLVCVPDSSELRVSFATFWLDAAVNYCYAPAIQTLIEIRAAKQISKNIAVDENAKTMANQRYSYASKSKMYDAIFEDKYDQVAESELVENPLYNPKEAKVNIAGAFYALEARRLFTNFLKLQNKEINQEHRGKYFMNRGMVGRQGFGEFPTYVQKESTYNEGGIIRWLQFQESFQLWQDDEDFCQELSVYLRKLCDERQWHIYDGRNMLLYRCGNKG